ncbi:MAG: nucleoside-diphosphate sugar epimerase/dehydratase [Candidatus Nanopelagicales bacterium]|nr:nucleoside-diphosphate sugar epimerase/dehydratase [Candidatus Nanopelagicales bacterium]
MDPVMGNRWLRHRMLQAGWDALSWIIAVPLALVLRYDFEPPQKAILLGVLAGAGAGVLHVVAGSVFHLYRGRYVIGSFDEVFGVTMVTLVIGTVGSVLALVLPATEFPRSTFILATGIAAALMLGARFVWRGARQQTALRREGARTLIYGAGDAGSQIATLMLADRGSTFQPVGFVDDDPNKAHLRRAGLRTLGTIDELEDIVQANAVDIVLVAIAQITAPRLQDLDRRCRALGVRMQVIPTATEIVGGAVKLGDISDVTEEDLMGRHPIRTDEGQITDFIRGRVVLVTGAGGSIGSELARQLTRYAPGRLLLLDRDESGLHALQLTLDGSGNLTSPDLILADIRDEQRVLEVFQEVRPEIVFHAAALKHLPLLERYPQEALKTNVIGTRNVLAAADATGVQVFANISTDKAADPTSVLGYSKLITERLTSGMPGGATAKYVSVRFGNVLGSRGSVIDTFRFQIAHGGPVTVTDERVTRYFMTVSEAVHLVLQASVLGSHGETLILDMGTPVNIADVARHMIQRSGRDIGIKFTGLRPGEKLDEVLVGALEQAERPLHPLISHTTVEPADFTALTDLDPREDVSTLLRRLATLQ